MCIIFPFSYFKEIYKSFAKVYNNEETTKLINLKYNRYFSEDLLDVSKMCNFAKE